MTPAVWLLDLDGVLWLGDRTIEGSPEAVARLRGAGVAVAFCTNNSHATVGEYVAKLGAHGVAATPDDVVTSAMAAGRLVASGERVLVVGGPGLAEAVTAAGGVAAEGTSPGSSDSGIDVVAVGFDPRFDYDLMKQATRAVLGGARLIASNDDPIYPSSDGPAPGAGSILASIERATGVSALVAGKPHAPMASLVHERYPAGGVMVGDSLGTDGAFAAELGWPFGLVLTGNTPRSGIPADQPDAWTADDLASLVAARLAN